MNPTINMTALKILFDCILINSSARIEIHDEDHRYEPAGAPIEVALFNLLIDNCIPIHERIIHFS